METETSHIDVQRHPLHFDHTCSRQIIPLLGETFHKVPLKVMRFFIRRDIHVERISRLSMILLSRQHILSQKGSLPIPDAIFSTVP